MAIPPAWYFEMPESLGGWGLSPDSVPPGAGKWVTMLTSTDIKANEYRTLEGGFRTFLPYQSMLDMSAYYTTFNGKYRLLSVPAEDMLKNVIPSKFETDSIIPLYLTNLYKGRFYGFEAMVRTKPVGFMQWEVSYAWFKVYEEGLNLPNSNQITRVTQTDTSNAPAHIIRGRCYFYLPHEMMVTLNGLWHTEYYMEPYDYFLQKSGTFENLSAPLVDSHLKLDCMLEKTFYFNKLSIYLWGKNLLYNGYVESYEPTTIPYPHIVHRTFGGGITYKF